MKTYLGVVLAILAVTSLTAFAQANPELSETVDIPLRNTADRIRDHGYPAEIHQVETTDNYVVTMFRIPYSHKLQNQDTKKPAILLQHGLSSCSDAWILSGPNDALAFLLADAGYDVWMGNGRGNTYSRNNTRLSPEQRDFWRFSWHEIGVYDVSAMIDYILAETGETAVHYAGHSQGTTVYFVLMAERPEYNDRIKTAHLMAPVAFMKNVKTGWAKLAPVLGRPNKLTNMIDAKEVLYRQFYEDLYNLYCKNYAVTQFICKNLMSLVKGNDDVGNMNETVAVQMSETHPAGVSSTQILHFIQECYSGRFCQLDYGVTENRKIYGQDAPPDYDVSNITGNLFFYYGDGDTTADSIDVEYLVSILPQKPTLLKVDPTYTHEELLWHKDIKEVINVPIINSCNAYEESL